ncbi:hypothetical protein [Prochlorococcus sp. MIT 1201]|uniref:hypothetical protein n=1 Tax=Prochlorococcus sp. MIT 1201 TaxID=3082535 RepID=UPI0039A637D9
MNFRERQRAFAEVNNGEGAFRTMVAEKFGPLTPDPGFVFDAMGRLQELLAPP